MKKIITLFAALLAAAALFAQTPDEIIARMDQETDRFGPEGFSMYFELKIPILGTAGTTVTMLGDKYKMVTDVKGNSLMHWTDGQSEWEYDSEKKEVVITTAKPSEESQAENNVKMLKGVTDGYDVKIKKETDEAWYLVCTKSRTNPNKDDPKKMELTISKSTYLPISVKSSLKGVTLTMRDFAIGATEADVTFNPADFPDVQIIDKR